MPKNERKIKIKQPSPVIGGEACPDPEPFAFVILTLKELKGKNLTQGKLREGEGTKDEGEFPPPSHHICPGEL